MPRKPLKLKISHTTVSWASEEELELEYQELSAKLDKLRIGLVEQITQVIKDHGLTLAFPIESRVKSWASIQEKLIRKPLRLTTVADLPDLVGIRVVLLFLRDLRTGCSAISEIFLQNNMEDASKKLGDSQFGYQSVHYGLRIPEAWHSVPTFSGCGEITAELQLRTIAQHTWAAASHILQYKHESNVPMEVRRSINRVSALLETVDLEFERALGEREDYLEEPANNRDGEETLNVDLLEATLDLELPADNKLRDEPYDPLLMDLIGDGITTLAQLRELIRDQRKKALTLDASTALKRRREYPENPRFSKGVYYSHCGLVRIMLAAIKEES